MLTGAKKSSPFPSSLASNSSSKPSKEKNSSSNPLLGMGSLSQTEMDVAKIIRSLPKLIRRSQTHRRVDNSCNVDWGVKKRRSGTASASSNRKHCNLPFSTSAPLPSTLVPESTAVAVQIPKVAALSPASPLLFYPSGGEETDTKPTVASSSSVSPSFRPSKKAKVRNKEWIKEQNDNLSSLFELNKNLQKEAEEMRSRYESLFAENTRLKEIKSKWEIDQKRITKEERQQQKEEAAIVLPEEEHIISPTPAGPTTAKVQHEPTSLTTTQTQPEVPIAPPQHHQFQYNHHHHQIHFSSSSSSRSLTLSASNIDSHGALEIPDLNARVDENGFVLADQQKQNFQPPPPPLKQQQVVVEQRHWIGHPDLKKAATAEARKKRIEINRRKAAIAAATAGGAALRGGNRVGLAVER